MGNRIYPKQLIKLDELQGNENAFCTKLFETLKNDVDVSDIAIEQRCADYRTVVYGDWNNDFLRYHFGDDGFWISVRMYPGIIADYEFSPLFRAQANKRQLHWRASIEPNEIGKLHDALVRSCKAFFGGPDCKKQKSSTDAELPKRRMTMRIKELAETSSDLTEVLKDRYTLLSQRDVILAGSNYHPASEKLRDGSVLTCVHEKDNPYDADAVALFDMNQEIVGYLPKNNKSKNAVLKAVDSGMPVKAVVINNGTDGGTRRKRKRIHLALVCREPNK
ncbi:HIRAN domain-containing protein [Parafannyhessea umbonata]|nr:HIRAN domain-containing protein [Parafannyhessea umbonata]